MNQNAASLFFQRYADHHDIEGAVAAFSSDASIHFNTYPSMNIDAYKQLGAVFLTGFPDLKAQVEEQIVSDDTIITRALWSGTHTGTFNGIPATGKTYRAPGIVIDRIKDGKIVERHSVDDLLGLMQQLGVIPMP